MRRLTTKPSTFQYPTALSFSKSNLVIHRPASSQSQPPQHKSSQQHHGPGSQDKAVACEKQEKQEEKKTMAQLDAELQQKMSGLSGDGGEAGVEYENGQPVAIKRSVKNLFRAGRAATPKDSMPSQSVLRTGWQ
ncbi:hypothetical protein GGR54DRAFT_648916 [Hypoxylon sp. NC1633]|nr:hypothetical protein GGR54DRAFT_648916 [Hypoxylon sp. NC1633]